MSAMKISEPLTLPCSVTLKNRLVKSAMSENMADNHRPGSRLLNLYKIWGEGEIGLIITGNIMVDKNELGEPDNVVLEEDTNIAEF